MAPRKERDEDGDMETTTGDNTAVGDAAPGFGCEMKADIVSVQNNRDMRAHAKALGCQQNNVLTELKNKKKVARFMEVLDG